MRLPLAKLCLIATGLLSTTCAFPRAIDNCMTFLHHSFAQSHYCTALEGVLVGRYAAFNCGSNNHAIVKLIHTLQQTLPLALTDTSMPDPGPAYTALFKEKANAPFVHGILYNIAHGIDVPIRANFTSLRQGAPAFVCATKPGQIIWSDVDGIVQDGYTDCMRVGAAVNALLGLRIIILCPDFFSFPAQPPRSRSQCMTVDPQHPDSFLGDGESMAGYQLWILLHELAHAYIYAANGGSSDIYLVNDNLDLQAAEAVKNAQSFTYYVANLFLDCTNFPLPGANSPSTQTHGIELLETKGHLISDATTMSSA